MFEGGRCCLIGESLLFQDGTSVTKRSQNKCNSLGGWQYSEGWGIKMDCSLNRGSITSPGSLYPGADFSKVVSGVRDCTSNTGDSDSKNMPGLMEAREASI